MMNTAIKYLIVSILLIGYVGCAFAQGKEIELHADAPAWVLAGERFRVNFVLTNAKADNIDFPYQIKNFMVDYGPSISTSQSSGIVKGKMETTFKQTFTYILTATKTGKLKLPSASVKYNGKEYKSKPVTIESLDLEKLQAESRQEEAKKNRKKEIEIKDEDGFIRTIVEEIEIQGEKAFEVTFRLYTTHQVRQVENTNYPPFEQFDIIRSWTPSARISAERYEGRNYYTADVRKFLLVPKQPGRIKVDGGQVDVLFRIKTGEVERSFFGPVEKYEEVRKTLPIEPFEIKVGLIGDYQLAQNATETDMPFADFFSLNNKAIFE